MISFLRGEVAARGAGWVEVDVGGIGFHLTISSQTAAALPAPGEAVRLPTALAVREDGAVLFGFRDEAERAAFAALNSVGGVGAKLAIAVLSRFNPESLARVLAAEDVSGLCAVPGVGRKTAQRLILELKDRFAPGLPGGAGGGTPPADVGSAAEEEARAALLTLGYSGAEALAALAAVRAAAPAEAAALVRAALRELGPRRP